MNIKCAHNELVELHKLIPHPNNANKHPVKQITLLSKIIDFQGQRAPIVVSKRSGFIVKGHGRLEAIQKLGWEKAAVDFQDYESEAQEYADLIADNKIAELADHDDGKMIDDLTKFEWGKDFDYDLLGLPDFKLPEVFEPQSEEDSIPEHVDTRAKLGDVWLLGKHRLMCGDSTSIDAVEKLMNGERADMVFTDPPYNQHIGGKNFDGGRESRSKLANSGLNDFEAAPFISILEIIKPSTSYIFCSKDLFRNYIDYFESQGLNWNLLVMHKTNPMPLHNNTFVPDIEWFFVARYPGAFFNNSLSHEHYLKIRTTTATASEFGHPTEKKVSIIEPYLELSSKKDDSVLDLFGGSGSTLIACEKTNRKCFMMELDPHYCDLILSRWEKYAGKTATLDAQNNGKNSG